MKVPTIKPEWLAGITMTQAQKDAWLAALRSGEYQQGYGRLKTCECYCCLGVAAKVVLGYVDAELTHRLDLSALAPLFLGPSSYTESIQGLLTSMKDGIDGFLTHSFAEIANFIEASIPACDAPSLPT